MANPHGYNQFTGSKGSGGKTSKQMKATAAKIKSAGGLKAPGAKKAVPGATSHLTKAQGKFFGK